MGWNVFSEKGICFYLIVFFLSSCRTFPLLIDGLPNRLVVNKDTGWSILSQRKFYTRKDRYSLQGMKDSFDVFYFEGATHTANHASLSSVPTYSVPWRFPYLGFAHKENEWLFNWDFAFSSKKFIATMSTNTVLDETVFRVLEQSAWDQWDLLVEFKAQTPDSQYTNISLGISSDNEKGILAYIDGKQLWATSFRTTTKSPTLTFQVLPAMPEKFLALQNNANESIFVYLDTTKSLHVKKMKNKSVIAERLISSFASKNVLLFQDSDYDYIIWVISDENNKLNIQMLNLNTYELTTRNKTPINGSNGILRKDKDGLFYLAFITPENKPRIVTTTDFDSWTQLGAYTISSTDIKDLSFVLFDTNPVIGYIDHSYLYLMIYNNEHFTDKPVVSVQKPVAVIDAPAQVTVARPFTASGIKSKNYNKNPLTYYWQILNSGDFNNPYSPTPSITIPTVGSYELILAVSDGIQVSDPVTNTITAAVVPPTKVNFTVIAPTDILESTPTWKVIDTKSPLKFYIRNSTDTLFVTNVLYDPQLKQLSGNFTIPYASTALSYTTFLTIEDINGNTIISSQFQNTVAANMPSALDSQDTVKITNSFRYSSTAPPALGFINWVVGASSAKPKLIELAIPARQLYTENFLYNLMPLEILVRDEDNNQTLAMQVIFAPNSRPSENEYFKPSWYRTIDPIVGLAYKNVKMYISNARGDSLEVALSFNIPTAAASHDIKITNNGTWTLKQSPDYPYAHLVAKDIGGFNGGTGELFHALKGENNILSVAGYSARCGLFFNTLKFASSSYGSPTVAINTNNNLDPTITPATGVKDLYGYFNPMLNGRNNLQYSLMYFKPMNPRQSELKFLWGANPNSLKEYAFTFTNSIDSIVPGSSRMLYVNSGGIRQPHLVFTYNTEMTASPNNFVMKRAYIPFDAMSATIPTTPIEPTSSAISVNTSIRGEKMRYFVVGSSTNMVGGNAYQNMWVTLGSDQLWRNSYLQYTSGATDFESSAQELKTFRGASYIPIVHTLDNSRELYLAAHVNSADQRFSLTRLNDNPSLGPIASDEIGMLNLYSGIPDEATKMALNVPTTNKTVAIASDITFHDVNSIPQQYVYIFWINRNNEVYGARALQNVILTASPSNPTWEHMGRIATQAVSIEAFPNEQNRPVLFIKDNSDKVSIYEINLK